MLKRNIIGVVAGFVLLATARALYNDLIQHMSAPAAFAVGAVYMVALGALMAFAGHVYRTTRRNGR